MYFRILVPIDGSAASERGLHEAIHLAAGLKAALVLLHVIEHAAPDPAGAVPDMARQAALRDAGNALLTRARDAAAQAGVAAEAVQREALRTPAAEVIVDEAAARECGLIVLGTHGCRGRTSLPLGRDAERVIQCATMPVLLARQIDPV